MLFRSWRLSERSDDKMGDNEVAEAVEVEGVGTGLGAENVGADVSIGMGWADVVGWGADLEAAGAIFVGLGLALRLLMAAFLLVGQFLAWGWRPKPASTSSRKSSPIPASRLRTASSVSITESDGYLEAIFLESRAGIFCRQLAATGVDHKVKPGVFTLGGRCFLAGSLLGLGAVWMLQRRPIEGALFLF